MGRGSSKVGGGGGGSGAAGGGIQIKSLTDVLGSKRGRELVDAIEESEDEIRDRGLDPTDTSQQWVRFYQADVQALRDELGYDYDPLGAFPISGTQSNSAASNLTASQAAKDFNGLKFDGGTTIRYSYGGRSSIIAKTGSNPTRYTVAITDANGNRVYRTTRSSLKDARDDVRVYLGLNGR